MQKVSPRRVAEIARGVFVLSNLVDLARPVSWVAPGTQGFDPSNCYLVVTPAEALLVDTGLNVHSASLLEQMAGLIGPATPLTIALTRIEPDCLGGLMDIANRFNLVRVASQSNVIPFDYLGPYSGRFPRVEIVNGLHAGDTLEAGEGLVLTVVEPAVRTLPTMWYRYEAGATLFTSDFFGEDRLGESRDWETHAVGVPAVRRHLLAKFDWLAIADTSAAIARLDRIFDNSPIEVLAPGHGLWVVGQAAVRERYRAVRAALENRLEGGS